MPWTWRWRWQRDAAANDAPRRACHPGAAVVDDPKDMLVALTSRRAESFRRSASRSPTGTVSYSPGADLIIFSLAGGWSRPFIGEFFPYIGRPLNTGDLQPMTNDRPFVASAKRYLDMYVATGRYSTGLTREIDAHLRRLVADKRFERTIPAFATNHCHNRPIPLVGAWLAWQQVQIARVKLQHDLFERRYNVFAAARRLLAQIDTHRRPSDEDLRAFMLGTSDAVFLFDDDLAGYLI